MKTLVERITEELDRTYAAARKAYDESATGSMTRLMQGRIAGLVWTLAEIQSPESPEAARIQALAAMRARYALTT